MIGSRFSPEIRRALRIDISATLLFTVFAGLTGPFLGLILRRELGATPLQLAVMSSAGGGCLLLSLLWAKACHGRPPSAISRLARFPRPRRVPAGPIRQLG